MSSSSSPKKKKLLKKRDIDSESSSDSDVPKKKVISKPVEKNIKTDKKKQDMSYSSESDSDKIVSLKKTIQKTSQPVQKPSQKPMPPPSKKAEVKKTNKLDYSESSDSEKKKEREKQDLRGSIKVEIPYEFSKGDKLVKKSGDYLAKFDDSIILLTGTKNTTVKLFPIREGKQDYVLSKKLIIKGMKGLLTHTIQCSQGNYFDEDKTKTSITIVGLQTCHLQTAGNSWIVISGLDLKI